MSNAKGMKPVAVESVDHYTTQMAYDGSNNLVYVGKANTGTATSATGWQIKKLSYTGTNVTKIEWAGGTDGYDKIWDDRATYSYS